MAPLTKLQLKQAADKFLERLYEHADTDTSLATAITKASHGLADALQRNVSPAGEGDEAVTEKIARIRAEAETARAKRASEIAKVDADDFPKDLVSMAIRGDT
jgi:hypothetical protein